MNAQQLFLALEGIDEQYIQEAETQRRAFPWKAIAATAAVLAVTLGAVWVSHQATRRAEPVPQAMSTPIVNVTPTAQPTGAAEAALSAPEQSLPEQAAIVPEADESVSSGCETVHEPPYSAEYVHNDEGDFLIFTPLLPSDPNGPEVLDITGQLEDGHYAADVPGLLAAQKRHVELTVYADGSYDLYWEHDPFNDTAWWLEEEAEP